MSSIKIFFLGLIFTSGLLFPTQSNSADSSPAPSFVSADLWSDYKQLVLFDVDGAKRNLKWVSSPGYYVKGTPKASDIDALNNVIATLGNNCDNLLPGRASQEPGEGVIFHFIPRNDFKTIISSTPSDITNSYLYWTYYLNRGITKAQVTISNELDDVQERNRLIRIRALQGFGFYTTSNNSDYNFLSNSYRWETSALLSKKDREMLSFFCSSLTRAWDTDLQTLNHLNSFISSGGNTLPNLQHRVKVEVTNFGATVDLQPRADLAISQGVREIILSVSERQGSEVAREVIDLSKDSFSIRNVEFNNLKAKTGYILSVYSRNGAGFGTPRTYDFRTQEITSKSPNSNSQIPNSSEELADAYQAADDAYKLLIMARQQCTFANVGGSQGEKRSLSLVASLGLCNIKDVAISSKYKSLLGLKPDLVAKKDIPVAVDSLNSLVDDFNDFATLLDETTVYLEDLASGGDSLLELEKLITVANKNLEIPNTILLRLPYEVAKAVRKNQNVVDYVRYKDNLLSLRKDLDKLLKNFTSQSIYELPLPEEFFDSVDNLTSSIPNNDEITQIVEKAMKAIPNFYCKKSKNYSLPNKGKCSSGYTKVPIS